MTKRKHCPQLSADPFGIPLATQVADLLAKGGRVLNGWSAHWLLMLGDRFTYQILKDKRRDVFSTPDRNAFIAWLAAQSSHSLDDFVRPKCNDTVELISTDVLAEAVTNQRGVYDPTPYGCDLATKVAAALDGGKAVIYCHRDYCGTGLVKLDANYVYTSISDGQPDEGGQIFATREDFITWLAAQSDFTLSARDEYPFIAGNQRVTRARLLEIV